jgi:hypothetical protein
MKQEKWRKLLNEKLENCDTSPDIARAVQNARFS